MSERRALIAMLLLAAAAAIYIWVWPATPAATPPTPEKSDAGERTKADPFPAADK